MPGVAAHERDAVGQGGGGDPYVVIADGQAAPVKIAGLVAQLGGSEKWRRRASEGRAEVTRTATARHGALDALPVHALPPVLRFGQFEQVAGRAFGRGECDAVDDR